MPIDWEEIKSWIKDTTKIAIKEAEDLTVKGKLKLEIVALSHNRERLLIELANLVYNEYNKSAQLPVTDKVKEIIGRIQAVDEKLKVKKEQLKKEQ